MRTSFIVLIALVLCTFTAAQRLEINGDNYSTSSSQQSFIQDVAQDWFMKRVGITKEDITSHLGLLVAGILHYFMENFSLGPFNGDLQCMSCDAKNVRTRLSGNGYLFDGCFLGRRCR